MKKLLVWCLLLSMMLAGCFQEPAGDATGQTVPEDTTQQSGVVPSVNLYVPDSKPEKESNGTLRVYVPEKGTPVSIGFMGEDAVIISADEDGTVFTRISGEAGTVKASFRCAGTVEAAAMDANRIVYYDAGRDRCVILDGHFSEIDSVKMPENLNGIPQISPDLSVAYYTADVEIRAMDLQTGIPRLVSRFGGQAITLEKLLFDATVLSCCVTDADGREYREFLMADTGRSLGMDASVIGIESWKESYLVQRWEGPVMEWLLSKGTDTLQSLSLEENTVQVHVIPPMNGALQVLSGENGLKLALLELEKGCRAAALDLREYSRLISAVGDPSGKYIWLIAAGEDGQTVLSRWDPAASGGEDATVRLGQRYTEALRDTEGLDRCASLAQQISDRYGVEVLLADGIRVPEDYSFTGEYLVPAFEESLALLDKAMAKFPEGFFRTVTNGSNSGKLRISLVRAVETNVYGAPDTSKGIHYWIDGNAYMALTTGKTVEQSFYHNLSHILDTYVYSNSIHYDFWNDNNPEGFLYDECYTEYTSHADSPWLQEDNRAFIDAYSMTFDYEDRATVMEYALTEGMERFFTSETMQAKLNQLCMGIRQAFGWRKYEGTFPWEQYLQESLAYVQDK